MDQAQQREGEARVRRHLIEPLEQLGLGKPSTLTKAKFAEMKTTLCQMLARMSAQDLDALAEICMENPGGKERDRFPIAATILQLAKPLMPAVDDPSPLKRRVFSDRLGAAAIEGGWAPELLAYISKFSKRGFPGGYAVRQIQDDARGAIRQMADIESALARGADIRDSDHDFLNQRRAAIARCQKIRDIGLADKERAGT